MVSLVQLQRTPGLSAVFSTKVTVLASAVRLAGSALTGRVMLVCPAGMVTVMGIGGT